MERLVEMIRGSQCAAAFTGAGVSTLCGIPDFRGPQGLYRLPGAERMFDIDCFRADPSLYYRGSRELVYGTRDIRPGPVHHALARLEGAGLLGGVITQNIDMLHQKAGSTVVFEVHGSGATHRCIGCGRTRTFDEICAMLESAPDDGFVPTCDGCGGAYKPDITFFGEPLPRDALEGAVDLAERVDLMLVLGSSLTVQPAASIPLETVRNGGRLVIVNAQPTPLDRLAVLKFADLSEFADTVLKNF